MIQHHNPFDDLNNLFSPDNNPNTPTFNAFDETSFNHLDNFLQPFANDNEQGHHIGTVSIENALHNLNNFDSLNPFQQLLLDDQQSGLVNNIMQCLSNAFLPMDTHVNPLQQTDNPLNHLATHHHLPHFHKPLHDLLHNPLHHNPLDNEHFTFKSAYSLNGQKRIEIIDDVVYRYNLDGSVEKVGIVTHSSDGKTDFFYDLNSKGEAGHLICNVNLQGEVHNRNFQIDDYWGKVTNDGTVLDAHQNKIGTADTNLDGAALFAFTIK